MFNSSREFGMFNNSKELGLFNNSGEVSMFNGSIAFKMFNNSKEFENFNRSISFGMFNNSNNSSGMFNNSNNSISSGVSNNIEQSYINSCSASTKEAMIGYIIYLSCILPLTVVGNSFVCLTIFLCRQLRKNTTNYFIFFLAVSDIAVAVFIFPFRIFMYVHNGNFCAPQGACLLYMLLDSTSGVASVTNLLIIALDRRFMITMPYRYPIFMRRKTAIFICLSVWIYAHLWSWLSTFSWDGDHGMSVKVEDNRCNNKNKVFATTFIILVYFVPLSVMGVVYGSVLRIARRQARDIHKHESRPSLKQNRKHARECKATKTLAIIYGAFVVCWLPNCMLNISSYYFPGFFIKLRQNYYTFFMFVLITFVEVLPTLNSAINPFIYAIFNRQFRGAFKEFLLRRRATMLYDSDNGMSRIQRTIRKRFKMREIHINGDNSSVDNGKCSVFENGNEPIMCNETTM